VPILKYTAVHKSGVYDGAHLCWHVLVQAINLYQRVQLLFAIAADKAWHPTVASIRGMTMDLRKLKTLIDLVSESNVSELEITDAEGKVRIVKSDPHAAAYMMSVPPMQALQTAAPVPAAAPVAPPPVVPSGHELKSPMVGTFYRASSPGAEPFVSVGTKVKAGERMCIVEAMKILNEIEADHTGTITKVLVEDGQAVEYGQVLFVIE
jgi:acetyl-CoA carboxylase biotin carboxyl carrier protein